MKSLEKFFKSLRKIDLYGPVEHKLRKYAMKDKEELIWIISVIIIAKEGRKETPAEEYLQQTSQYL